MNLTIIFGPMFSGKTTRLIQELTKFMDVVHQKNSAKCLLLNHIFDNRNPEIGISSHGSSFKGISSLIEVKQVSCLKNVNVEEYNVIGIDEAQFFEDLEIVKEWVNSGKNVIISGLIADAFMNPFGKLFTLVSFADNVIQCHSICAKCLEQHDRIITPDALSAMKAAFTFRLDSSNSQIEVGAADKYIPVCRFHYQQLSKNC